jgi:hypothetical protein
LLPSLGHGQNRHNGGQSTGMACICTCEYLSCKSEVSAFHQWNGDAWLKSEEGKMGDVATEENVTSEQIKQRLQTNELELRVRVRIDSCVQMIDIDTYSWPSQLPPSSWEVLTPTEYCR